MSTVESPASELVSTCVADQLAALRRHIATANTPGNLDGLFAYHVLADEPTTALTWAVDPFSGRWMAENRDRAGQAPHTAILGYGLTHFSHGQPAEARALLGDGLSVLSHRDPFPPGGMTFLHDPRQLLGVALGALAVPDNGQLFDWLAGVLHDAWTRTDLPRLDLIRRHVRALITGDQATIDGIVGDTEVTHLALVHWMILRGTARLSMAETALPSLRRAVLAGAMRTPAADLVVPDAALLYGAARHVIDTSLDAAVLNRDHVGVVLRRFEPAMRRWRFDVKAGGGQIQWPIGSEREVQDIVWLILRSAFDDVVDEEPLRKLGHSSYIADFGIPSLGVLIEIKYARSADDLKKIEKQVMEDAVAYPRGGIYSKLVVFIYDESASVQEHELTAGGLRHIDNVIDVVIVSRPSHLPAVARVSKPRRKSQPRDASPTTE